MACIPWNFPFSDSFQLKNTETFVVRTLRRLDKVFRAFFRRLKAGDRARFSRASSPRTATSRSPSLRVSVPHTARLLSTPAQRPEKQARKHSACRDDQCQVSGLVVTANRLSRLTGSHEGMSVRGFVYLVIPMSWVQFQDMLEDRTHFKRYPYGYTLRRQPIR